MVLTRATARRLGIDPGIPAPIEEPERPTDSPFFRLSGELRNMIYRFTLSGEEIDVTRAGHSRSNFLRVNHFIRSEALAIFYYENTFNIKIDYYDIRAAIMFLDTVVDLGLQEKEINYDTYHTRGLPQPHWPNLLYWLKMHHARRTLVDMPTPRELVIFYRADLYEELEEFIIGSMFVTARKLRKYTWNLVEAILEEHRTLLKQEHTGWKDHPDEEDSSETSSTGG